MSSRPCGSWTCPLPEIRAYLDRRSPGELVALLEREGALLDRKLRRLRQMRDLARQKAALIRSALARTPGVVAEEVQPEALLVCTPSHPMTSDADSCLLYTSFAGRTHAVGGPCASPWSMGTTALWAFPSFCPSWGNRRSSTAWCPWWCSICCCGPTASGPWAAGSRSGRPLSAPPPWGSR